MTMGANAAIPTKRPRRLPMPLSWNEIRARALVFSREWVDESSEDAEGKSFWDGFFNVFGITRRRVASFEKKVKRIDGKDGYIDLLWKGVLLVEQKSRGKDLDRAYAQATDYFPGLKERDLPRYVLVSDFARFRLYDLETGQPDEFPLRDLHKNIRRFGFIAGYQPHEIRPQDPANIEAAERMGRLYDQLRESGYKGHPLQVYLVRLLFCLFAEDTGIFEKQQFREFIERKTAEDGSDLGDRLATLFYVLNTPDDGRLTTLDEDLAAFPYVNGRLFEEPLPPAAFDTAMRQALLDCCGLDWSRISPAIFGSLFQSVMDPAVRRNLGAHYTREENILKLIRPLFLDALQAEFERVRRNRRQLEEFHKKLASLHPLDDRPPDEPADLRGVRELLPPSSASNLPEHRVRPREGERPPDRLVCRGRSEGSFVHPRQSAVRREKGADPIPEGRSYADVRLGSGGRSSRLCCVLVPPGGRLHGWKSGDPRGIRLDELDHAG